MRSHTTRLDLVSEPSGVITELPFLIHLSLMKKHKTLPALDRSKRLARWGVAVFASLAASAAHAQNTQYFAGDGSALTASKYSVANGSPSGPFTQALTSGNIIGFGVANGTGIAATLTLGGVTASQNFTLTTPTGTFSASAIIPVNVASNFVVDFSTQNFISGTATGGYSLSGGGVFATAGNTFGGGVTLGGGSTLIARGVNTLGSASTDTLVINNGILASSKTNDFSGKIAGGITIGGDFQLGILSANSPINGAGTALIASDTYNQTFTDKIALGTATTRTITLGNRGTQTFGGIISGNSGLTFSAVSGAGATVTSNGVIALTGTANTFTGAININGPEVTFAGDGSLGNTANMINIEGGRFTVTATSTITAGRGIQVGSTAGTSISAKGGSTVVTYNGVISNLNGETGSFAKQGGGTLALGGVSTYAGDTSINNGTLQLTTGNNRLPTGTTVNVGQSASANVGIFDLNGQGQQIAGLISVTGTNASTTAKNTVTSAAAATLTLSGSGTYAYGDSTAANSGVLTGALAVSKTGSGTQTLGDANTYVGATSIAGGTLLLSSNGSILGSTSVQVSGTGALTLQNSTALADTGALTLMSGTTLNLNAASGTSETIGALILDGTTEPAGTYTAAQLMGLDNNINFSSLNGETLTVTPVPEPTTVLGGLLLVGAAGCSQRRRVRAAWLGLLRLPTAA